MAEAEAAAPKKTKPDSPEELLKRARRAQGLPEDDDDDEHPKLFDDAILDDFQECLLKLERRVKEGPGSLNADEVLEFESAAGRILVDMNGKFNGGGEGAPAPAAAVAAPAPVAAASNEPDVIDTSNDEGPAYTGKGGMGLSSETRNTWLIPGMDEMTPEEYQMAIQKSVIARQEKRREEMRGVIGQRASHQYLDTLGWGGASASLAAEDEENKGKDTESRPDLYDA